MTVEVLQTRSLDDGFARRVFYGFAALALAALAVNLAGRHFGAAISDGGHTADARLHEVVIGNDVVVAPANAIRHDAARVDGVAPRLDLYLRWPDMAGYTAATRDDFNAVGGRKSLIFLNFEPRGMSRDMSGRLAPIYRALIEPDSVDIGGGVRRHRFTEKSGYLGETLAIRETAGGEALVARCLDGEAAQSSLAPCERDIHIGDDLSLTYRFPAELLSDWPALEAAVRTKALEMVKTAPR